MHNERLTIESRWTPVAYEEARARAERVRAQYTARAVGRGLRALGRASRGLAAAGHRAGGQLLGLIARARAEAALRGDRELVRQELLRRSDRTLEDMGFARGLLEMGVDAWPWTLAADANRVNRLTLAKRFRNAVRELHTYSDAELTDLGISRGGIEHAVLHGRPGIDPGIVDGAGDAASGGFGKAA